jgi:sporulation protein YlmC with PRC-barrel domain
MQKVTNIEGFEIVTINEQRYIGMVEDVLIDASINSIKGFIITDGESLFGERVVPLFVPFHTIKFILHNVVIIDDIPDIIKVNSTTKEMKHLRRFGSIRKLPVLSSKEKYLGDVLDLLFDPANGNIKALVLTNNVVILLRSSDIIIRSRNVIVRSITIEKNLALQRKNEYFKLYQ